MSTGSDISEVSPSSPAPAPPSGSTPSPASWPTTVAGAAVALAAGWRIGQSLPAALEAVWADRPNAWPVLAALLGALVLIAAPTSAREVAALGKAFLKR